jgi:hypothetical protein
MNNNKLAALYAEVQKQRELYLAELKTTQKFQQLKEIRLKINKLMQQITANEQSNKAPG